MATMFYAATPGGRAMAFDVDLPDGVTTDVYALCAPCPICVGEHVTAINNVDWTYACSASAEHALPAQHLTSAETLRDGWPVFMLRSRDPKLPCGDVSVLASRMLRGLLPPEGNPATGEG